MTRKSESTRVHMTLSLDLLNRIQAKHPGLSASAAIRTELEKTNPQEPSNA